MCEGSGGNADLPLCRNMEQEGLVAISTGCNRGWEIFQESTIRLAHNSQKSRSIQTKRGGLLSG